jgi:hypothetical protein
MSSNVNQAIVLQFPDLERRRRAHVLRIAGALVPLLQAAVETGNASLVQRVFRAMGELACGDAMAELEAIRVADAEVVEIRSGSSR